MRKILLAGALLASTFMAQSQTIRCGSDSYLKQMQQYFPEDYARVLQTKADQSKVTTVYKTNGGVYTVPVVVHIVYNTTGQDISESFVTSQIDVLNKDYRRLNADVGETPGAFATVAADAQIEFCLAQQDPDGVISSGITHTETTITNWNLFAGAGADNYADNVKFTDKGGEDAWPRTDYLNIWVCNLSGGLLGYATPPGGPAGKDGVVIGYKYFGDGSPGGVYNLGRTATHEIGHWLGLAHIWGDDDFAAEPQCGGSDDIADTPNQEDATYGHPTFPQFDDCAPATPGYQFMNYMDYVDDGSMNMFTQDQADVMRGVLEGTRSSILESPGCQPGGVDINDVLKNQFIQLSIYPNPSSDVFVFEMKNFEHNELTIEVFNSIGERIDRMIVPNTNDQKVVFDASALSAGNYLVKASDGEFILTQQISVVK